MKMYVRYAAMGCGVSLVAPPLLLVLAVTMVALFNGRTTAQTDFSKSALRADPPPPLEQAITLKIITYNIADAYLFTTNRPERIRGIAAKLTELDPDIVGFQEAFVEEDRQLLVDELKGSRLKYHVTYPSTTVGNGLLVVSAWPIKETYFHRFEASNPWYKVWEGDWWAGKGVGLARIALPKGGVIDFYNTHAQASRNHPTGYREVRERQMAELARFLNESRLETAPGFIVGDFNTAMGKKDLDAAITGANLVRVMTLPSGIDHIFAIQDPRYRFDVIETMEIDGQVQGSHGAIFLGRGPTPAEVKAMFFGAGEITALSDHTGYMSTVRITPISATAAPAAPAGSEAPSSGVDSATTGP